MFLIHPVDLRRRRRRCLPLVQALSGIEREFVKCCNVCGAEENVIIAVRDRYGIGARTAICRKCGLVYLVDRFTAPGYSGFYQSGSYRMLSARYNGTPAGNDHILGCSGITPKL